jgi:hypothetical protein
MVHVASVPDTVATVELSTLASALPSLKSLLEDAKLFSRSDAEEQIQQHWRDTRDKLVLDYKRRRKDARKRAAGVGDAVAAAAAEADTAGAQQTRRWSRKRRGGISNKSGAKR